MDAQGAVDSLLGRLTAVLVDEAQLLGGVRGDVQFIKDEMECMNSVILHLTEAEYRGHHVRAWMKQVVGLARDCEGYVELYVRRIGAPGAGDPHGRSKGLLGCLRRLLQLLRTIPVRHRVGTRIKELKVRARDVSDRRLRYGVPVPESTAAGGDVQYPRTDEEEKGDLRRRAIVLHQDEPPPAHDYEAFKKITDTLIELLLKVPPATAAATRDSETQPRVFSIVGGLATRVAEEACRHPLVKSSFRCRALVDLNLDYPTGQEGELRNEGEHEMDTLRIGGDNWEQFSELLGHLKGKRFLIIVAQPKYLSDPKPLGDVLPPLLRAADGCHPGSTIIISTYDDPVALLSSPCKIINARNLREFYKNKADNLSARHSYCTTLGLYQHFIFDSLYPNAFAMKMLLHFMFVNPNMTDDELKKYDKAIDGCKRLNKSTAKQVLVFCYNELPVKYRSYLLYLTIFPKGHIIRTTSLARRWMAEGLINTTAASGSEDTTSATEEAERCLDVLLVRGFLSPVEITAAGNIKTCTIHDEVHEFIARIAKDVSFVDTNLPQDLVHHLSIHNRIGLQASDSDSGTEDIVAFLPSLAASSQWQLLKVLDLEGCQGLKKHHLKSICKILLLKYLSLRNTDITQLPKQIKELQCLETLDIRQTKVQVLSEKAIVLPLLKIFLAGHKVPAINDARRSEESFSTVRMPLSIQRMRNIEILSHVQISNSDSELASITQLLKLRKFGVALHGKNAKLNDLFSKIEKLQRCLRSLSIWIDRPASQENHDAGTDVLPVPQFIESLNINGITSGVPHLIQNRHRLSKITLSETYMKEDDLRILGKLHGLSCLKLQQKSYIETELSLKKEEFQRLEFLLVEGRDITNISFVIGSAPKLKRIVWSSDAMQALSGAYHLPELEKLELNGDCNLDQVREEIIWHPKYPSHLVIKHNPRHQRQEDGTGVAASST